MVTQRLGVPPTDSLAAKLVFFHLHDALCNLGYLAAHPERQGLPEI